MTHTDADHQQRNDEMAQALLTWLLARERGRTGDTDPVDCPETPIDLQAALQELEAVLKGKSWSEYGNKT